LKNSSSVWHLGFGFADANNSLRRESQSDDVLALVAFDTHPADKVIIDVKQTFMTNRAFRLSSLRLVTILFPISL